MFISWSGPRSRLIAQELHGWLQDVLQNVEPWMSQRDIGAGARWGQELDEQLDATDFGILCITPENAGEPWLHYEAGALAKRISASAVVPYLIDMTTPAQLPQGPLSRFQAKVALTETWDVLECLNAAMGQSGISDDKLHRAYGRWWPDLERALVSLPSADSPAAGPTVHEMVSEILEAVRGAARSPIARPMQGLGIDEMVSAEALLSRYWDLVETAQEKQLRAALNQLSNDGNCGITTRLVTEQRGVILVSGATRRRQFLLRFDEHKLPGFSFNFTEESAALLLDAIRSSLSGEPKHGISSDI